MESAVTRPRAHDRAMSRKQAKFQSGDLSILVFIVDRRKLDVGDVGLIACRRPNTNGVKNTLSIWFSECCQESSC